MTDHAAIAQRVIELVGDRAEAQATVVTGESALTRFANSFIHQNVADATRAVTVKVAIDGKVAKGTDNRIEDAALSDLVDRTLEAAKLFHHCMGGYEQVGIEVPIQVYLVGVFSDIIVLVSEFEVAYLWIVFLVLWNIT